MSSCVLINLVLISKFIIFCLLWCLSSELTYFCYRGLSNISFTFLPTDLNEVQPTCSVLHPWNNSLDVFDSRTSKRKEFFNLIFIPVWFLCVAARYMKKVFFGSRLQFACSRRKGEASFVWLKFVKQRRLSVCWNILKVCNWCRQSV